MKVDIKTVVRVKADGKRIPVVVIRTYKHGEGFRGVEATSNIGSRTIASILSGRMDELVQYRDDIEAASKHYHDEQVDKVLSSEKYALLSI